MSFRSQSGSRRGASRQFSKSSHEKKAKEKKQRSAGRFVEEGPSLSKEEFVNRTVNILEKLGNQIFALSPYSQYFDDWLVNLRQTISEFESAPSVSADQQFTKECEQIFLDVEGALAEKRLAESNLTGEAKALADNNHFLVETDKEYAEKTRDLSVRRNSEVQRLSKKVRDLEEDIACQQENKISVLHPRARKQAAQKLFQTRQELRTTKNQLETALQSFTAEQEKLHDAYEKKKQEIAEVIESLHKTLENLENDDSITARQTACNSLTGSINALLKRVPQVEESS